MEKKEKRKPGILWLDIIIVVLALLIGTELIFVKLYKENKICSHSWEDGYCIKCYIICDHEWHNGKCAVCGLECEHEFDENSRCEICGDECEHEWKSGKCEACEKQCEHTWENGICTVCGKQCLHEWKSGVCTECKEKCGHEKYIEGVCIRCGVSCSHKEHDKDSLICKTCGKEVCHTFTSDGCTGCRAETPFQDTYMPEEILDDVTQTGTVVNVFYETKNYPYEYGRGLVSETITKSMMVYLPYGYDPNKQYDVLFLLHGANGNEETWLCNITDYRWYYIYATKILDGMIEHGYCKPLIVAAPTTYTQTAENGRIYDPDQFVPELTNDILPYIVNHYATYAYNSSNEEIQKVRDHFGIAGFSDGALFTLRTAARSLEKFSWFGAYSGNNGMLDIAEKMDETGLGINFFFAGSGDKDLQHDYVENEYAKFKEAERIEDGVNAKCMTIIDGGHSWTTWDMCLYNTLLVFFNQKE